MASPIISYKCPACGAPVVYDESQGKILCEYCDSTFTLEEIAKASSNDGQGYDWGDYKENVSKEDLEGTVSYVCHSCGAEIVTDRITAATSCPYCGNVVVVEPNLTGFVKPNKIIPFHVKKEQLKDIVHAYTKKAKLLPKDFITENKIKEVQGMYLPFWLFSAKAEGSMLFRGEKVRTWSDRNYHYTETSYYDVNCDGGMSFSAIPVDGSRKADNALMDSIEPFNYGSLVDFQPGYLSGFVADRFDEDADASLPRADSRIRSSLESKVRSVISEYSSVRMLSSTISLKDTNVQYALLPVYLITTQFGKNKYQFAVNGQTGKMAGDLPVSKKRAWGFRLAITAGVAAVNFVIYLLLH